MKHTEQDLQGKKFLCDEMLRGLGRWLRVAGYDTRIAQTHSEDKALLHQAKAEGRWLLTRDRALAECSARCLFLPPETIPVQAIYLSRRLAVDWLARPFSRCLRCNVVLEAGDPAAVPFDVHGPVHRCPSCGRNYWWGSHTRRMGATLERWSEASLAAGDEKPKD